MEWIYKAYHKVENWGIIKGLVKVYRRGFFVDNIKAENRMKQLKSRTYNHKPIRVVFIGQSTTSWNKQKAIYEKMKSDERFTPVLLAVSDEVSKSNSGVYEYFFSLYGSEVVKADLDNGFYDLKSLEPDYVFYQRPYDRYLPKEYRSKAVSKYAKICYLTYGFLLFGNLEEITMPRHFFRNTYIFFAENSFIHRYNYKRYAKSIDKGYRLNCNVGYPSLEDFLKLKDKYSFTQDGFFKVLWSPRWSDNIELGGSSFMKFKDDVVRIVDEVEGLKMIFRPHPMTFNHFIEEGKISEEEAIAYKQKYTTKESLQYDTNPDYTKSLWEADVLMTDISSIIAEFFLSERPIIYCETGAIESELLKEMKKGMYCVDTWEEAKQYIIDLMKGIDPLKHKRIELKKELFGEDIFGATERYLEIIADDFGYKETSI